MMASQPFKNSVVQIEAQTPLLGSATLSVLRQSIVFLLNIALISARMLFSVVLLDSVINWNDHQWTTLHVLALIPFCWTTLTIILAIAGQFRWKVGGRIMTAADIMVSAAAIIFFPAYALSAIALAILSLAFLVLRHDGRFATLLSTLPLAAMLVRPLGGLEFLHYDWPIIYVSTGMAGEFVAFVISSLATFFSILIIVHIRIIEQPLTFQQPWEEEFSVGLGKHNIQPIMNLIRRIYPSSRLICILDRPNRKQSEEIIICSPISQLDVQPLRLHLINYSDHGHDPTIMALDDGFQVDVESGQQSTIPATFDKMVRELTRLGFQDGVLFDFKLADIRGRLFFSTGTPVEEAFRNDMVTLKEALGHFFDSATTWDTQRKKMMGFARDSARRDLHDGILQSLAALKMRLITILAKPSLTSYPELENLRKTVDIITVEQSRLRALLHNDEHEGHSINLVESIEVCLKTLSIQWDVSVSLVSLESALSVDQESADNIEFLVREMIANAIRHSDAQKLIFMMALNKGNLMIALKADLYVSGNSIDIKKAANQILASRSLMQRLAIVNGHAYSQDLEESTLLAISVPLEFTEND